MQEALRIICEIVLGHVMVQVSIGRYTHTPPVVCKQIYPGTSLYTHREQKKGKMDNPADIFGIE